MSAFLGGCTSSYEALSQGTTVVSYPSNALRGRFTLALLNRVGLRSMVASSLTHLSELAIEVPSLQAALTP